MPARAGSSPAAAAALALQVYREEQAARHRADEAHAAKQAHAAAAVRSLAPSPSLRPGLSEWRDDVWASGMIYFGSV
jgi:hypothetical protein